MIDIDGNKISTFQRKNLPEYFFRQNEISGQDYSCPHYDNCRNSHNGIFYEGQLHHVGNHYDISLFDQPFRRMVVRQDYGHGLACVSMEDRGKMVMGYEKDNHEREKHAGKPVEWKKMR